MRGTALHVQRSSELWGGGDSSPTTRHILTFRIERDGMQPVPVQLKGFHIDGMVAEGDEVSVDAEQVPGKVVKAKRVENHTTGVPVEAYYYRGWTLAFLIIALLAFAAWMLVIFFVL